MYVKWVIRRHKNEELANIVFYDAYLVQSYKNEVGEPRQRTIAYLGNLRQIDNSFPVIERALFYIRMEDNLVRNVPPEMLTDDERQKLYNGLATVAPAPTETEIRESTQINNRWYDGYWKARALKPADASAGFAQIEDDNGELFFPSSLDGHETGSLDRITVIGRLNDTSRKNF
jgi:hypothetical protein